MGGLGLRYDIVYIYFLIQQWLIVIRRTNHKKELLLFDNSIALDWSSPPKRACLTTCFVEVTHDSTHVRGAAQL